MNLKQLIEFTGTALYKAAAEEDAAYFEVRREMAIKERAEAHYKRCREKYGLTHDEAVKAVNELLKQTNK